MTEKVLDPANFHVNQWPMRRYRISDLDRTIRHEALSDIFDALSVKGLSQRLKITRKIIYAISLYHRESKDLFAQNRTEENRWFAAIGEHAGALVDLATAYPRDFGNFFLEPGPDMAQRVEDEVNKLLGWATLGERLGGKPVPLRRGARRNMKLIVLIDRLSRTYQAATGERAVRKTDWHSGKPTGSFHQFIRGVYELGDIGKGDAAIDGDIERWRKWIKLNAQEIPSE